MNSSSQSFSLPASFNEIMTLVCCVLYNGHSGTAMLSDMFKNPPCMCIETQLSQISKKDHRGGQPGKQLLSHALDFHGSDYYSY